MGAAVVRAAPARTATAVVILLNAAEGAAVALRGWRPAPSLWDVAGILIFSVTPVALGLFLRSRSAAAARASRAAVAAARRQERVELARELHDVVAHHIGGIVVQAQAAQVVPGTAAPDRLLPLAERAGTDALAAMRQLVTVLHDGEPGGAPAPTMDLNADLRAVATAAPGGSPVRLTIEETEPIPAAVGTSVLRLVQESVTNARRHAAGAREIAVTVRAADGLVRVTVRDDGRPGAQPQRYGGGFGLVGMRERVQLLGGRFTAGREPDGGWQVTADLPLGTTVENRG
ncbi:sensor histidine kinase [Actinoplanes awajinensis]|uniref:histidine kinase n=1 Tax=Actinoplanes awajinensis subsp. mycoplanecinus TaxID=135947 RepID=A0A101JEE9_9ACTN|nr:ATP-binding protein [Actinoplanes awajinensis]KUL25318.1 hypothetical protein ADL15_41090 [Actinoplanes awajinensis subsp. mycoplanecinus]